MQFWWNGREWVPVVQPLPSPVRQRRSLFLIVAAITIAVLVLGSVTAVAVLLVLRAHIGPTAPSLASSSCSNLSGHPATLPPELFTCNDSGPVINPFQAKRVATAFWPIEEKALATDDRATTDLIEGGPAAEYADAISCEDIILRIQSIRTVRPLDSINVYLPRQTAYPAYFLAEVGTTVYGRSPINAPNTAPPPGTPNMEYLVFVKTDAHSAWKVVIDTGYAGGWGADAETLEDPAAKSGPLFEAAPPRPSWIDPSTVPQALAAYWQHWVTIGGPPPDDHFAAGTWTTSQGAYLQQRHMIDLAKGVVHHTRYFVDLTRDGAYQFAVDNGVDLECFAVRYADPLTAAGTGARLIQDTRRENFGALLAPGLYSTIVASGFHQSCALIPPSPSQPLLPSVGPGIGVVGGQGGDTRLTGSSSASRTWPCSWLSQVC